MRPKENIGGANHEALRMNVHSDIDLEYRKDVRRIGFDPSSLDSLLSSEEYESWLQPESEPELESEEPNLDAGAQALELVQKAIWAAKLGITEHSEAFISGSGYDILAPKLKLWVQDNPFVHLYIAETPEVARTRLIESFRATDLRPDGPVIADRIEALQSCAEDEGEETNFESLQFLFKFLLENRPLPTPDIVITNHGNYRIQWRKAPNKYFAIEFYTDNDVKYVCFQINLTNPEKIGRSSGTSTVDDVVQSVMVPTHSLEWICE